MKISVEVDDPLEEPDSVARKLKMVVSVKHDPGGVNILVRGPLFAAANALLREEAGNAESPDITDIRNDDKSERKRYKYTIWTPLCILISLAYPRPRRLCIPQVALHFHPKLTTPYPAPGLRWNHPVF